MATLQAAQTICNLRPSRAVTRLTSMPVTPVTDIDAVFPVISSVRRTDVPTIDRHDRTDRRWLGTRQGQTRRKSGTQSQRGSHTLHHEACYAGRVAERHLERSCVPCTDRAARRVTQAESSTGTRSRQHREGTPHRQAKHRGTATRGTSAY